MERVPVDEDEACHNVGCVEIGIHAVSLRGHTFDQCFCCAHMHDLMREVGEDQPDFEVGFAKFQAEHFRSCGYSRSGEA